MTTLNLDKKTFVNYVSNSTITDKIFTSTGNSQGVLITLHRGTFEVKEFGNVKVHNVSKTRRFVLNNQEKFIVNGKEIKGTQTWIQKNEICCEAFVDKKDETITIEMATDGYIFVNDTLINFSGIKLGSDLSIKTKEGITYFKSKAVSRVFYHGHEFKLETDGEKYVFPKNLPIDEFIYAENKDGSFNNLVPVNFSINTVTVPLGEPFYDFTKNYRCSPVSYNEEFGDDDTVNMSVTRFNKETVQVRISTCSVPLKNFEVSYIEVFVAHEKIPFTVNYESFNHTETVTVPVTDVKFQTGDGSQVKSTIIRYVIPYTQVKQITRYEPFKNKEIQTDEHYILNGEYHCEKNSSSVTISLKENEDTLETYCKSTSTWTVHDLRQESYFNENLSINIYTDKNPSFDLRTIGYYDEKDTFSMYIDGAAQKSSRFYLTVPTEMKDNFIQMIKFSLVRFDKVSFNVNVSFFYAKTSNVNFVVPEDDIFGTGSLLKNSFKKSVSFKGNRETFMSFEPYVDYGQFQIRNNETVHVHQNSVTAESKIFKTFPFIRYADETSATVEFSDKSLPLKSIATSEDMKIDLLANSDYVRLNDCSSVEFKNSALFIPAKTSFCFFKASDDIYMIKSADLRTLSMNNMSAFGDRRKSLAQPKEEDEGLIKSFMGFMANKFGSGKDLKTSAASSPKQIEETEPEVLVGSKREVIPETVQEHKPVALHKPVAPLKPVKEHKAVPDEKPVVLIRPAKPEVKPSPPPVFQKPVTVQNNSVSVGENYLLKQESSNVKKHKDVHVPEIAVGTTAVLTDGFLMEISEGRHVELPPNLFIAESAADYFIPQHIPMPPLEKVIVPKKRTKIYYTNAE